jgi:hypothetical protein
VTLDIIREMKNQEKTNKPKKVPPHLLADKQTKQPK